MSPKFEQKIQDAAQHLIETTQKQQDARRDHEIFASEEPDSEDYAPTSEGHRGVYKVIGDLAHRGYYAIAEPVTRWRFIHLYNSRERETIFGKQKALEAARYIIKNIPDEAESSE